MSKIFEKMKNINISLTILFILFAIVQLNDPDPFFWIAIYLLVATVCGLAVLGRYHRILILLGLAICGIELFTLFPDFMNWVQGGMPNIAEEMKAEEPHIELTREFLGLVVCGGVLIFQYFQSRKVDFQNRKGMKN